MKKIMTLMLGLSFLMGTVSLFAGKTSRRIPLPRRKRPRRKKADKSADEKK